MPPSPPPPEPHDDLEAALEAQQLLLENSLSAAVQAYRDGISSGMGPVVVYVVDCEDDVGGQIVRAWLGDEQVDDAIAERRALCDDPDETTVFTWGFAWEEAVAETSRMFPYLAPVFADPPAEGFLAISVTAGGASALTVPPEAFP